MISNYETSKENSLGHPPPHLHVPGVDEEHSPHFFTGLVDRVQLGGVEVQAFAAGADLEAWHAQLLNLHDKSRPIQFLQKLFFVAYCSLYLLHCQSGRLHRKSPKANESGRIPVGMVYLFVCIHGGLGREQW